MKLTKQNIQEWKQKLTSEMLRQYEAADYATCMSDEDWLDLFEGETPQDAIDKEVSNWF